MTSLVTAFREMVDRRAVLVAELSAIDQELAELREALVGPVPAAQPAVPPPSVVDRSACDEQPAVRNEPESTCETCGKAFVPAPGVSGRFCSRDCYAMPLDERRACILEALKAGPAFPSKLATLPELQGISKSTVNNDLYALGRQGLIVSDPASDQEFTERARAEEVRLVTGGRGAPVLPVEGGE